MVGQSQKHLQGVPPHLLQLFGSGLHHHALTGGGVAGRGMGGHALHRDDTEFAGAYWLEVRMMAKSRDVYARLAHRIHDGGSLGDLYLQTIDLEFNCRHVPTAPAKGGD